MAKGSKKWRYLPGLIALFIYILFTPRRLPQETVLKPRWITSLESSNPFLFSDSSVNKNDPPLPFTLGDHFGYLLDDGNFIINQKRTSLISLSENAWAEYEGLPSSIQVMDPYNKGILTIESPDGYPLFLDRRNAEKQGFFIVAPEQNSITAVNPDGEELWTYDFPAPITCVDGTPMFLLAGTLDGTLVLLDPSGHPVFTPFEPGGSRLSVILGCAISGDATRLAIISGIDEQRFLLLEQSGDTYKVIYHEFLSEGYRRPVHLSFIDNDSKIVFEREGGLAIFNIGARSSLKVNLKGKIAALDTSGEDGFLFAVTSIDTPLDAPKEMHFVSIRYPELIINEAPLKSNSTFFARRDRHLYLGGDLLLASFELKKN